MAKVTKSKWTNEEFVPVKSITNGMIILDNNQKVSGIETHSVGVPFIYKNATIEE